MKTLNLKTVLTVAAATVSTVIVAGQPVQAGGFKTLNSDWNIVLDSFNDGTTGGIVGSTSDYEMFGMAAKVEDGQAYFAINGNLNETLPGNGVTYGDLFFNFSGKSFKDASAAAELFGVRFAPNDAGDGSLEYGLYQNATAKSVTSTNSGHSGFASYVNKVETQRKDKTPGENFDGNGTVGFGDLTTAEAQEYLTALNGGHEDSSHSIQNVIKTGTKVAGDGFAMLSAAELAGLDFGTSGVAKAKTFGFKFDAAKLPEGNALITLLHECFNDGMAMKAKFEVPGDGGVDVPEPSSIVSLGLIGLALAGSKLRKQNS
jgi:hypothetical protein